MILMAKAKIGIIAEDNSDIDTLLEFIVRITDVKFKKATYASQGCGKLMRKCQKVSKNWISQKRVTHIIICHDLDRKRYKELYNELHGKISALPNCNEVFCIVIPIEEMEAWFLSDSEMLNRKYPGINIKEISHPEKIKSPKEYIERKSRDKCKPRYLYTTANPELAKIIDIPKIQKKCPEFKKFHDFVSKIGKKKTKKRKKRLTAIETH